MIEQAFETIKTKMNELVDRVPEDKKELVKNYFANYIELTNKGRHVEAKALTEKFTKEYGSTV